MPASWMRRVSHRGLGRDGSRPSTVSAVKTEQASDSSATG